ncbi:hypothetical protein [Flavobacterium yafengii]|uniref:hypothetical protein n=1 Tax=Flavobacterium yafengii TaxID=3041253 RepID=UPI0024A99DE6|nr:hypothetical protein [Flavobacterium yafengii]MDI5897580.1 hypothetical protein [Flavobacterium yafengii]MDI6046968.1 hypothetical protein [Flavobacterium yafengii]
MKKIILLFIFFLGAKSFAQTNGITYQAVILNPNRVKTSDLNNSNLPLASKDICMLFKFVDEYSNVEYQEVVKTKTDPYGMVNLVIGTGTQTSGYAISFDEISWDSLNKSLVVGINVTGDCTSFTEISNQPFSSVPFAYSSIKAVNVTGVVAIENGGTNATTVLGAKTNLGLENVDNTTDLNKPISDASKLALNLKEDAINKSTDGSFASNSDVKFPTEKATKTYVDASTSPNSLALNNEISRATTAENTIATNLVSESERATLAETTLTTNLTAEVNRATTAEVTKEDAVNKSTDGTLISNSDVKFPTEKATKMYVDANIATSNSITQTLLDAKAPLESPTFTGTPFAPTPTAGTATSQIATTNFVTSAIADMSANTSTNFVDLTTNQTIAGTKIFTSDATINGVTVGRGKFNENSNTAVGLGALETNAGYANTGIGRGTLALNDSGNGNTTLGYIALSKNVSGGDNVSIGGSSLLNNITGSQNTAIGNRADVSFDGITNSVAIGANAIVTASNTIQLGSDGSGSYTAVTNVNTSAIITATGYKIPSGTAGQYLMANGSVSAGAAVVMEIADEFNLTESVVTFSLSQTPSANSKVKMYVNGIRISNSAYSWTETTLTYIPANNGSYSLSANDRIQFDYFINE